MSRKSDTAGALSRRSFLQGFGRRGCARRHSGTLALPKLAAAQDGGLVALVHTQAAGDNGPIDSMIAALKKLSEEKGFPIRTIYAQDAGDLRDRSSRASPMPAPR